MIIKFLKYSKSLQIFLGLFALSFFSEFIANENPILIFHKNRIFFPIFKTYSERDFGGIQHRQIDFHNSEFGKEIIQNSFNINPFIPYSPNTIDYNVSSPHPPSSLHLLGTDDQGRDLFTRLLYGTRISLLFSLILTFLGTCIGIALGAFQGYFGKNIDMFIGRIIEIWRNMPSLFITIIISSTINSSIFLLLLIMLMFNWIPLATITRTEFLRSRSLDYVRNAEILGVSSMRIIFRHILPNSMIAIISYVPFMINTSIVSLTSLDFLGFGLPPHLPSLGEIAKQAKDNIYSSWIGLSIFTTLSVILILLIFIGEDFQKFTQKIENA